ncbi:hypothetical protein [Enterovibrio norvegicus]|uniref:hypothetical protein n=1 Tax=Enterovibrio norvegicus TaxID=188144 RepID=UPI00352CA00D
MKAQLVIAATLLFTSFSSTAQSDAKMAEEFPVKVMQVNQSCRLDDNSDHQSCVDAYKELEHYSVSSELQQAWKLPSRQDLMEHFVAGLERQYIGKPVDFYDAAAVSEAYDGHQQYLMLCAQKMAVKRCDRAAQDKLNLERVHRTHSQFRLDIMNIWATHRELDEKAASSQ